MALGMQAGTFLGTGSSGALALRGKFNLALWGTFEPVTTVKLERSFDDGANWFVVARDATGAEAAYSGPANLVAEEPEGGVLYRLSCTAFAEGSAVSYRLSQ